MLPRSRNHTYQPKNVNYAGSQVRSFDLNDLQDQIIELWGVGAFRLKFMPYRIADSIYSEIHTRVGGDGANPLSGLAWSADGSKLFAVQGAVVKQFAAARPFSHEGISEEFPTLAINAQLTGSARGLFVSPDGLRLFVGDNTTTSVLLQYTLASANSLTGATYSTQLSTTQDNDISDFVWSADGTRLFLLGDANNTVYQYNAATPWSIVGMAYALLSLSVAGQTTSPRGIDLSADGKVLFVRSNHAIFRYSLPTANSLSGASYTSVSHTFPTPPVEHGFGLRFSNDGTRYILPAEDPVNSLYASITEFYCTRTVIG